MLAIAGLGCDDFIDLKPENAVTYTNGMETATDMEAMLTGAQSAFQGSILGLRAQELTGAICNGCKGGGMIDNPVEMRAHSWDNSMVDNGNWVGYYNVIGLANVIICNTKDDWSEYEKNYFLGQSYFLKGMCYFDLARRWGKVPVVPEADFEAPMVGVSSNHDVLEEATRCALKAFEHLPLFEDLKFADGNKITNKQYANKEIAAALLAHLYAWRAAAEEGITSGKSTEYWVASEKYASMLIDGELKGYATLENSISALCDNTLNARRGEEVILELELDPIYTKTMPSSEFYVANKLFGYPYKKASVESECPVLSISCKFVNQIYGEYSSDERKTEFFDISHYDPSVTYTWPDEPVRIEYYEPFPGWVFTQYVGGLPNEAPNRAYVKKFHKQFLFSNNPNDPERFVNFDCNKIIWRLADIILLRAEVRNFMGNTDLAIGDLNIIRNRAKAEPYPSALDTEGLQKAIFREREKELIYENHRFFDIMRNKDYYKTELPANLRMLSEDDIKDGALFLPISRDATEYNFLMTPNKYWFNKRN